MNQTSDKAMMPAAARTFAGGQARSAASGEAGGGRPGFKNPIRLLLGLGLFLLPSLAVADATNSAWITHVWQSDDGLPNNDVTGLAQTPDGYLWVATPTAHLARFDGVKFETFSDRDIVAGHEGRITRLLCSRDGSLWFAMDHGPVGCLKNGTVRVFTNDVPDEQASTITEDSQGGIWVTYRGTLGYRIAGGQGSLFPTNAMLSHRGFGTLATDGKGQLWCGNTDGIGVLSDGRFLAKAAAPEMGTCVASARDGKIWVCSHSQLAKLDGDKLQILGAYQPEMADSIPTTLLEDRQGGLWIGTSDSGLFHYNGSSFEKVATSHPQILCLLQDTEDNIWVGTGGGGLDRIQSRAIRLEGTEAGLPFAALESLCEDTNGTIWAATQNYLLAVRTNGSWHAVSGNDWPGGSANCLAVDRAGSVWIATGKNQLYQMSGGHYTVFGADNGFTANHIHSLLACRSGDLWIGSSLSNSLQRLRAGHFTSFPVPPRAGFIRAMCEDASGNVWAATSKRTLLKIQGDTESDLSTNLSGSAMSTRVLTATPDGSLWLGYAGYGIGRYKDGVYTRATTREGLFDDNISEIAPDGQGWLWVGCDRGVFKVRIQDFDDLQAGRSSRVRSVQYGASVGLSSLQANFGFTPGSLTSRDGRVWLPMLSGVVVADPAKLGDEAKPPPVFLTRVTLDERPVAVYGGVLPPRAAIELFDGVPPAGPAPAPADSQALKSAMRIPPSHSHLDFEFSALSFRNPENIQFRYQLEGYENIWHDPGAQRHVSYVRLPAGNYRFRVRACNGDGVWNENGAAFAFIVTPFFWQTWWFRIAGVGLFTAVVLVIGRVISLRRMRRQLEEVERQGALESSRMAGKAEIATSVLHNVGNVLNSVNVSGDLISDKLRGSKVSSLEKLASLLGQHAGDLPGFIANHPQGRELPGFISGLAAQLLRERDQVLREVESLRANIGHIEQIIAVQQDYARVVGQKEPIAVTRLLDDALRVNAEAIERHHIRVVREYGTLPPIQTEKHKVFQILVNLISNAKYAMSGRPDAQMTLRAELNGSGCVKISVADNGVGISSTHLERIFQHGFTTRKDGHGFGLHSSANAARELGGSLKAYSEGPGRGAVFVLELPCAPREKNGATVAEG